MTIRQLAEMLFDRCKELDVGESRSFTIKPPLIFEDLILLDGYLRQMLGCPDWRLEVGVKDCTVTITKKKVEQKPDYTLLE